MSDSDETVEKTVNDGKKDVIDYLLKSYRSIFKFCVRKYEEKIGSPIKLSRYDKAFFAEQLDMISCVCEFLANYDTYRLDRNVHSRTNLRWEFPPSMQVYNKTKLHLKGPLEVARNRVSAKAKESMGEDDSIVDMQLAIAQVAVLIDRYPQISPYIKNDSSGVGDEQLFEVLNALRRDCGDAHQKCFFGYDLYNPPKEEKTEEIPDNR